MGSLAVQWLSAQNALKLTVKARFHAQWIGQQWNKWKEWSAKLKLPHRGLFPFQGLRGEADG